MNRAVISQWRDTPNVLRMTRKADMLTIEIVGVPKDKIVIPWADFLADVEKLK